MDVSIIEPQSGFESTYHQYIVELGDEERYPFPLDFDYADFPALLEKLNDFKQGVNLPVGYVSSSTYWLVSGTELLGVSNLRHSLNDNLKRYGGHIGMGIRPSYRGRGLGNRLLAKTVEKAKSIGIDAVHIHCYKNNIASAKMIQSCGGKLVDEAPMGSNVLQRYVII